MRPELEALPDRMRDLPVDDRGYPVPWFVAWLDGKPEFRAMDAEKWIRAVRERRCWVCGHRLGQWLTFVVGPMCGINRTTSEPASHLECARWSARNCPFLSRPNMVRREDETTQACENAGIPIKRNPGVSLLWTARSFSIFNDGAGKPVIQLHDPESLEWWCEGKPATRAEVEHSVDTGIPIIEEIARADGEDAMQDLARRKQWLTTLYPPATFLCAASAERAFK
ncbi:MAG: hypothetical protein LAQ69_14350 [Acidobacteriia bacterium]|nr:hypothetical protein [Terriglobia bacterium]